MLPQQFASNRDAKTSSTLSAVSVDTIFEHREPVRKPRWRKVLPWLVGALAVAAAIAIVAVKWSNTGTSTATPLLDKPADDRSQLPTTVKLAPGAQTAAREFIRTAVARQNLRRAYGLAGPQIRQGMTLQEWMTGNIPVVPYPVDLLDFAPMKIDFSYRNEAQIEVALLPKEGAKVRATLFIMSLVRDKAGHWLVNSWVPRVSPALPKATG
jgi:hypothetical protein